MKNYAEIIHDLRDGVCVELYGARTAVNAIMMNIDDSNTTSLSQNDIIYFQTKHALYALKQASRVLRKYHRSAKKAISGCRPKK